MKKYEEDMKEYEKNMKKYVENMIYPPYFFIFSSYFFLLLGLEKIPTSSPLYRRWDLEKFQARASS